MKILKVGWGLRHCEGWGLLVPRGLYGWGGFGGSGGHKNMGFKNLLNILTLQFLSGTLRMRLALPMCQPSLLGNPCCTFIEDSCLLETAMPSHYLLIILLSLTDSSLEAIPDNNFMMRRDCLMLFK